MNFVTRLAIGRTAADLVACSFSCAPLVMISIYPAGRVNLQLIDYEGFLGSEMASYTRHYRRQLLYVVLNSDAYTYFPFENAGSR